MTYDICIKEQVKKGRKKYHFGNFTATIKKK